MPEVMAGIDSANIAERPGIRSAGDLTAQQASALFVDRVPIAFARQHKVLGMQGDSPQMSVAIAGLGSLPQLRMLGRFLGVSVRPVLASEDQILAAINVAYQQRTGAAQTFIEKLDHASVLSELATLNVREDLLDCGGRAPVIKLVNLILFEAMQARASDVHVQPYESELVVRMRIDGVLYDQFILPNALQDEVIGRLKVMGRMNIAEKRLPQDGRDTVQVGDRSVDLRIASLPTSCGERVVIRLLDKGARLFDLEELGMEAHAMRRFRQLIQTEHGLILVTGPTGSGKSTTLYAALQELDGKAKNILTLEDPIEFRLEGISQTQVNERKGLT
ncbi:MAG: GspE/PulE family protein, partial [Tepidisphaeraceae bacterium]